MGSNTQSSHHRCSMYRQRKSRKRKISGYRLRSLYMLNM
jgi:hypothetical protein